MPLSMHRVDHVFDQCDSLPSPASGNASSSAPFSRKARALSENQLSQQTAMPNRPKSKSITLNSSPAITPIICSETVRWTLR